MPPPRRRFHVTTLGCPKNAVDSDTIAASLVRDGLEPSSSAETADLLVLNTCAFVEAAREESIAVALELVEARRPGARLVLTGCLAERYGAELREALPEVDAVVGFAGEATLASEVYGIVPVDMPRRRPRGVADLLDLPRAVPDRPWAYLKVAEGCDRACAFCAIPMFRGRQVSRTPEAVEDEARRLVEGGVSELVLVAQDLAWYGRDQGRTGALIELLERLDGLASRGLRRQRLLYLYPSEVREPLIDAVLGLETVVPYFDLSLQHASAPLLRAMKRWGGRERFERLLAMIRSREPEAVFRSSFIVGFPGETEADHDELLGFLEAARLDWAGFFPFSAEDGTPAASMSGAPSPDLVRERIAELAEVQDPVTAAARAQLVGREVDVLIDEIDGASVTGRTFREAPEIDGLVELVAEPGEELVARQGALVRARVTGATGPDLEAVPLLPAASR